MCVCQERLGNTKHCVHLVSGSHECMCSIHLTCTTLHMHAHAHPPPLIVELLARCLSRPIPGPGRRLTTATRCLSQTLWSPLCRPGPSRGAEWQHGECWARRPPRCSFVAIHTLFLSPSPHAVSSRLLLLPPAQRGTHLLDSLRLSVELGPTRLALRGPSTRINLTTQDLHMAWGAEAAAPRRPAPRT